ncbi:hypothetical protein TgHK011_000327 [Trichoderma gracile]|nr:hypothetical protein TgHK011_000327 [Trichoderma gracile]
MYFQRRGTATPCRAIAFSARHGVQAGHDAACPAPRPSWLRYCTCRLAEVSDDSDRELVALRLLQLPPEQNLSSTNVEAGLQFSLLCRASALKGPFESLSVPVYASLRTGGIAVQLAVTSATCWLAHYRFPPSTACGSFG